MKKQMNALLSFLFVVLAFSAFSQTRRVSGNVTDESGEPAIAATVKVTGTSLGAVTGVDGNFTINNVPASAETLTISSVGYSDKVVPISDFVKVKITEQDTVLDDIVVVGYETVKKSDLTEAVSTVNGKEIEGQPIASVDQLLQGKATGVQITSVNGKPGNNAYVNIRGLTSINGNGDPIFIVDGVPVPSAVYSAINPSDIASLDILKDAAATSIYGARASAGVVLITTKTGSVNNSVIKYDFQYGTKRVTDIGLDMMNAEEKLRYEEEIGFRGALSAEDKERLLKNAVDWSDVLLRDGLVGRHDLSFSGGSEKGGFFASVSKYSEEGLSIGSKFDRITARVNADYDVKKWLNIGTSISYTNRKDNELRDRYNVQSPFVARYLYNPYETPYKLDANGQILKDENGKPVYNLTTFGFNIIEAIENNPESRKWDDVFAKGTVTLTPIQNFTVRSQFGYNFNTFGNEYFIKPGSILDGYVGDKNAPGIKRDSGSTRKRITWSNTAQYDFNLNDKKHDFSILAGTEFIENDFFNYSVRAKGFNDKLSTQESAAEITGGTTDGSDFGLFSMFSRLRYDFNEKYFLTGTIRRDGSSRFGKNNRYGNFGALGFAWDVLEEDFFKDSNKLSQLKLRASYGTTGNEPVGLYSSLGNVALSSYSDQTATVQTTVANPNLKWETQKAIDLALDFGLFENRLSGSVGVYQKTSEDLLFPGQLSRTTGFSAVTENQGSLRTRGVEFESLTNLYQNKDWFIDFKASVSSSKSQVISLNTDENVYPANSRYTVLKKGEKAFTYELVDWVGVDPATGDAQYKNANGEVTTSPVADDAVFQTDKTPLPTYFGTFGPNITYKGFNASADFYFSGGNYIYNTARADLNGGKDGAYSNQMVTSLNYWKTPGQITDIARPEVPVEPVTSTRFLEKGDYVRLRNVRFGYTLPEGLTKRIKSNGVSFFLTGVNLLTFTKFEGDPEVGKFIEEDGNISLAGERFGYGYPQAKSLTGGVSIKF